MTRHPEAQLLAELAPSPADDQQAEAIESVLNDDRNYCPAPGCDRLNDSEVKTDAGVICCCSDHVGRYTPRVARPRRPIKEKP